MHRNNKNTYTIRLGTTDDKHAITIMMRDIAHQSDGIVRTHHTTTDSYIQGNLQCALTNGCIFIAHINDVVVGAIYAYRLEPAELNHILGELTIAVQPNYQGKGIGRALFSTLLEHVQHDCHDISYVELMVKESNLRAISLYVSLGFSSEERIEIDAEYNDDIPMVWFNQNYQTHNDK